MKIAFVIDIPFPADLAASFRIGDTAKELKKHDVTVICQKKAGEMAGINIIGFEMFPRFLSFLLFPLFAFIQLMRLNPDAIVISSPPLNSLFLVPFFRNAIVDVRDISFPSDRKLVPYPFYYKFLGDLFEKRLIEQGKRIVVVSPLFRDFFPGAVYIPNGTDTKLFKPKKVRKQRRFQGKKVVLYSGSLSQYHMPDFLLEVISRTSKKRKDVVFVFIGGGTEMDSFLRKVNDKGLSDYAEYLGNVSRKKVVDFINSSDVCIATMDPDYIGLSVKIADYMACGKPTVSNLKEHKTLFNLPVFLGETPDRFATHILNILSNRVHVGSARKHILRDYDRRRLAKEYEKVIKSA